MLLVVATALVASLVAGFALGGRIHRLGDVHFVVAPLAMAGLAIMVLETTFEFSSATDRILIATGYVLAAAFLLLNLVRSRGALRIGIGLLALGWILNAAVMVPNGGMPLSLAAYESAGHADRPTPGEGGFFKIVRADEDTVLRPLGDVIPLKPYGRVVSVGDLVLLAGLSVMVTAGMRGVAGSRALLEAGIPSGAATA